MGVDKIESSVYLTFDLKHGVAIWKFDKSELKNNAEDTNSNKTLSSRFSGFLGKIISEGDLFSKTLGISWEQKIKSIWILRLFTLFLFFLFIVGVEREKSPGAVIYFFITVIIFFLVLSFNPIARYYLPLIPIIWIFIIFGFFSVLDFIFKKFFNGFSKFNIISFVAYILILFLLANAGFSFMKKNMTNPLYSVENSESRIDFLNWLRANLNKDDLYTMGPEINWQLVKGTWILPPTKTKTDFPKFNNFLNKHNVSYVVIDKHTIKDMTDLDNKEYEKDYFQDYFTYDSFKRYYKEKKC